MFKAIPALLAAFALLLAGCEAEVQKEGDLPSVDLDADPGQIPKYEVKQTRGGELPSVDVDPGEMPEYDVEQTQEGELPSVDVDADPGRLPEVEVRGPDIEVGRDTVEVPVPDIDVEMPEEQDQAQ